MHDNQYLAGDKTDKTSTKSDKRISSPKIILEDNHEDKATRPNPSDPEQPDPELSWDCQSPAVSISQIKKRLKGGLIIINTEHSKEDNKELISS